MCSGIENHGLRLKQKSCLPTDVNAGKYKCKRITDAVISDYLRPSSSNKTNQSIKTSLFLWKDIVILLEFNVSIMAIMKLFLYPKIMKVSLNTSNGDCTSCKKNYVNFNNWK